MRSNICCLSDRCGHVEAVITRVQGGFKRTSIRPSFRPAELWSASFIRERGEERGKQERRRGVYETEVSCFVFKEGCCSHGDRSVIAFVLKCRK